nr:unnamed protein product [Digitaria exilis]
MQLQRLEAAEIAGDIKKKRKRNEKLRSKSEEKKARKHKRLRAALTEKCERARAVTHLDLVEGSIVDICLEEEEESLPGRVEKSVVGGEKEKREREAAKAAERAQTSAATGRQADHITQTRRKRPSSPLVVSPRRDRHEEDDEAGRCGLSGYGKVHCRSLYCGRRPQIGAPNLRHPHTHHTHLLADCEHGGVTNYYARHRGQHMQPARLQQRPDIGISSDPFPVAADGTGSRSTATHSAGAGAPHGRTARALFLLLSISSAVVYEYHNASDAMLCNRRYDWCKLRAAVDVLYYATALPALLCIIAYCLHAFLCTSIVLDGRASSLRTVSQKDGRDGDLPCNNGRRPGTTEKTRGATRAVSPVQCPRPVEWSFSVACVGRLRRARHRPRAPPFFSFPQNQKAAAENGGPTNKSLSLHGTTLRPSFKLTDAWSPLGRGPRPDTPDGTERSARHEEFPKNKTQAAESPSTHSAAASKPAAVVHPPPPSAPQCPFHGHSGCCPSTAWITLAKLAPPETDGGCQWCTRMIRLLAQIRRTPCSSDCPSSTVLPRQPSVVPRASAIPLVRAGRKTPPRRSAATHENRQSGNTPPCSTSWPAVYVLHCLVGSGEGSPPSRQGGDIIGMGYPSICYACMHTNASVVSRLASLTVHVCTFYSAQAGNLPSAVLPEFAHLAIMTTSRTTYDVMVPPLARSPLPMMHTPPAHDRAKACIYLRHHIHPDLEYLEVKYPLVLWTTKMHERFGKQKTVLLPQARCDWAQRRFVDFKTDETYNTAIHRIVAQLCFYGQIVTELEMIEETPETFHPTNMMATNPGRSARIRPNGRLPAPLKALF